MGVPGSKTFEQNGTLVHFVVPIGIFQKNHIWSLRHNGTTFYQGNSRCQILIRGKIGKFIGPAVPIGILTDGNPIPSNIIGKSMWIILGLYHPKPAPFVPGKGNGVNNIGLGGI